MGGRAQGTEWVGQRTAAGGIGDSWSINLETGVWKHFSGTEYGKDIISLFAELLHMTQGAAADEIRRRLGIAEGAPLPAYLPPRSRQNSDDGDRPIPHDAPALLPHPEYGEPDAVYSYGDQFVVVRYLTADTNGEVGKTFRMWSYGTKGWRSRAPNGPRRLYHLEQLAQHPDATVLVVEGEKCVERAAQCLQGYVTVTWAGGTHAWDKTDWTPLQGRSVLIWPDADDPGRQAAAKIAAHLTQIASSVRVINPNGHADGWDIADAMGQGWGPAQIEEFIQGHVSKEVIAESDPEPSSSPVIPEPSRLVTLASLGLDCDDKQIPHPTLANASKILQAYERFKGHIWFDDFRGAIYHTLHGPLPRRWTDAETRSLTVNVQQQLKLPRFNSRIIEEGLRHAAECNRRNSLTEWLDSLVWDGMERLDSWLADYAGIQLTDYTMAVARNWPIGMVARAYQPGCKMDNMPVLEGVSGLRKTQFLGVMGGEWYKALSMQFGEKDFLQALRGAWLIEIPDMAGFNRADHGKVLAVITTAIDTYRVPYGREPEDVPRTCVFAATSETDDYLSDTRGKRRYWPLRCTDINLDGLRAQRDQLFAEAVLRYREGQHWYEMPDDSTQREQLDRSEGDEWTEPVLTHADHWWEEYKRSPIGNAITAKRLLLSALEIPVGQLTSGQCRRVTAILKGAHWKRVRDAKGFFIWIKRERA